MAVCSSSQSRYCEPSTSSSVPLHDIFLSHSGAQKPFAYALNEQLRTQYTTFFDVADHSLPLGSDFTRPILHAVNRCRMALIVLSEEYLQSRWPMLELHAFFEATPRPKIVPLFFKVAPSDLRRKVKKEKWRTIWDGFAMCDSRINVSNWECALRELAKYNGIQKDQCEEEHAYISKILSRIWVQRHDVSDFPGIHRMSQAVLAKFEKLDKDESKVCVLMIHGLPGSGKSTLCKYLHDSQFIKFCGRRVYLDLSTAADSEQVLVEFKHQLEWDFDDKVDFSGVSHLSQVHYLKGTHFSTTKILLIIDNIFSPESYDFVKELLRLDLAVGSKVLIVAGSIPPPGLLLQKDYVYECMCVPYLSKEEALHILLRSGSGMDLADAYVLEASTTLRHRQIMEEVVDMCSTEGQHLPSVLNIVGYRISKLDVQIWNEKMKNIVRLHKKDAVNLILKGNFRKLSKNLQTLFLDLALFIVPLCRSGHRFHGMGEDYFLHLLSHMHGWKQEELELEMEKLQKCGFLKIWKVGDWHPDVLVLVHDFYLEFAASIEEACNYFWSGLARSNALRNEAMGEARTIELRTVVLELDESHEDYEFGQEHASVKAVILRNCQLLKVLRGTANLTSLVIMQIFNCLNLKKVQRPAAGCNLQIFEWSRQKEMACNAEMLHQQALEAKSMTKKPYWNLVWEFFSKVLLGRRSLMVIDDLLIQMKKLVVLRLVNTGIRKPVDLSGCLPLLRVLQVLEPHMKRLRACDLPNLELLMFSGDRCTDRLYEGRDSSLISRLCHIGESAEFEELEYPSAAMLSPHELRTVTFEGCPKLQVVHMRGASLGNELQVIPIASSSSNGKELFLNGIWSGSRLPDFTAVAESLQWLRFTDIRGLENLNFMCAYEHLRQLWLSKCPSVVQVTGLDGLPVLESLTIWNCQSLKILSGLGSGLAGLRFFEVKCCPKVHFQCLMHDLESLTELEHIVFWGCHGVMNQAFNVTELANLRTLILEDIENASTTSTTGMLIGLEYVRCLDNAPAGRTIIWRDE